MAVGTLTSISNDSVSGVFECIYTADATATASSIFCGFTPRSIIMQQIGGAPGATWHSEWHHGMTAGYQTLQGNTGAGTIPTSNGFTPLYGTEASPTAKATNSPESSGPGFTIGTGAQGNSLVYKVTAIR